MLDDLPFSVVKERDRTLVRYKRGRFGKSRAATLEEVAMFAEIARLREVVETSQLNADQMRHAVDCRRHFVAALRSHAKLVRMCYKVIELSEMLAASRPTKGRLRDLAELRAVVSDAEAKFARCREQTGVSDEGAFEAAGN